MQQLFFTLLAFSLVACATEQDPLASTDLIPARIVDLRDYGENGVVVVLKGENSPPVPIIIGHCEARALMVAMQDEDIDEALVREREAELRNINADVHKVNEIFRDLATLVDKQQDDVDKIGDLVERSHAHAEKGLDQVQKAAANQSSCALM